MAIGIILSLGRDAPGAVGEHEDFGSGPVVADSEGALRGNIGSYPPPDFVVFRGVRVRKVGAGAGRDVGARYANSGVTWRLQAGRQRVKSAGR